MPDTNVIIEIEGQDQQQGQRCQQERHHRRAEEQQGTQAEVQTGQQSVWAYVGQGLPEGIQADASHSGFQGSNENQFMQQYGGDVEEAVGEPAQWSTAEGMEIEYGSSMGFMDLSEGDLQYEEPEGEGTEGR